jgi:23S rRNA (guanosine2251-2'-O)-methyltransferase
MDVILGIHAVEEALKARGRAFEYIVIDKSRKDARLQKIFALARELGVAIRIEPRPQLDRMAQGENHQGVVAIASEKKYVDLQYLIDHKRGHYSFLLALDGIEDPHNLGAIMRTADAAGVDGIVLPERRSVGVNATVVKVSAGAAEHLTVAKVTNLSRAVEEMKEKNIWTVGLDERGAQSYEMLDYKMDCAFVLGAEGHGLHEKIRGKCDFLISIPMLGKVSSLNVSVAAGVVMYELVRQRRAGN